MRSKTGQQHHRRGHQIITRSRDWLEQRGFPVIYGDTDSLFVAWNGIQRTAGGRNRAQAGVKLNQWWHAQLQRDYGLESFLEIEFETHFIRFLMPTIRGSRNRQQEALRRLCPQQPREFK